ncbi:signal peptidase I [Streptomyces salyersiae]|uniref:Signal peptidase I n=1 Tax=Streptomyces salyersiae TaxID=3075530 RepID=A0ABU2RJP3_9ACTN|nr:signal peptidase I [Streptomyces sp. DSM 41770]MDT0428717.1 signal peptidase I [Streptomyces sp. DSM 41770]
MAVGARSGHDGPEDRPSNGGLPADAAGRAESDGRTRGHGPGDPRPQGFESAGSEPPGSQPPGGDSADDGSPGEDGSTAQRKQRSFWKELPLLIGIALILALLIKTFLVQAFSIPSDSMQNTLQRGDRVLVDKLTPWFGSEPERGEVVVFHDPGGWLEDAATPEPNAVQKFLSFIGLMPSAEEKDLIKRVIAVGGDTVECKKNGPVTVNGKALDDKSFIFEGNSACDDQPFGPIHVPEGRIWVMGDHRQNSLDSRYHQELPGQGTVSVDEVVGRAVLVAWPVNRWATLPVPKTFDQPGLNAAAAAAVPGALGVAGALPLVFWRRRRLTRGRTAG